jgi:hypothetical protein
MALLPGDHSGRPLDCRVRQRVSQASMTITPDDFVAAIAQNSVSH